MMRFAEYMEGAGRVTVYRGTGPEGVSQMRPSEGGTLGAGIYFYDNLKSATAYAERGGGVIVGEIDPSDPSIRSMDVPIRMIGGREILRVEKVYAVPDASKVRVVKVIPTEELL